MALANGRMLQDGVTSIVNGVSSVAQPRARSRGKSLITPFTMLSASPGKEEERLVKEARLLASRLDLASWSDLQLKTAIDEVRRAGTCRFRGLEWRDRRAKVLATVDEGIRRRLGPCRLFDEGADLGNFDLYRQIALGEGCPADLDLAGNEIVDAFRQVHGAGRGRYGPDLLFPAAFYRAVEQKDVENRFAFQPTDQQLLAGLHLLAGRVVDMQAGEGKTVAIAFAAVMHSILGRTVHVMTANDYLADRDSRLLAPLYRSLGLTVDAVLEPMESFERKAAYGCDVVYGTLREFGFDYLRDNMVRKTSERVTRGYQVAIVDEADQALIDEAGTPLIISGPAEPVSHSWKRVNHCISALIAEQEDLATGYLESAKREVKNGTNSGVSLVLGLVAQPGHQELRRLALERPRAFRRGMARVFPYGNDEPDETLVAGHNYLVDAHKRYVTLTARGVAFLEDRLGNLFVEQRQKSENSLLNGKMSRRTARNLELASQVYQSLRAHLLLENGVDYLVSDGSVILLDQYTGRLKPDSVYQDGLQTALAAREGVSIEPVGESLARISVQGFMSQYPFISGITGTAIAADHEFQRRYSLEPVTVPTANLLQRVDLPSRIYADNAAKLTALVQEVADCNDLGRPVLVGVQTVEQSLVVSQHLQEKGIKHRVLNAARGHEEAEVIRCAGEFGAITVATNMAGRGTDIILAPELEEQLLGRCVELVLARLNASRHAVAVRCNSPAEAAKLYGFLSDFKGIKVHLVSGSGNLVLMVASDVAAKEDVAAFDAFPELGFGMGLHVISAEFNRFPRVAVQLKGRSGRQGHFGSTRCLLSWEDPWLIPLGSEIPAMEQHRKTDTGGRTYFEGPGVDRCIGRRQAEVERETFHRQSVLNDFAAVMDAQTGSYYRLRAEILERKKAWLELPAMALKVARRLVEGYYPELDPFNYRTRFVELKRAAEASFGLDISGFEGAPMDKLAEGIADNMVRSAESSRRLTGETRFEELARHLMLECADEAWIEHQATLRRLVLSSTMGNHGHKSAVADYVMQASERWGQMWETVEDNFLSRLLTFPAQLLQEGLVGTEKTIECSEEVALLIP